MDPMANISSQGPAGAGGNPAQNQNDSTVVEARDVCDFQAMKLNEVKMDKIKSHMGIVSGCAAGIMGMTNLYGLLFFFVCHLAVNGIMLVQIQGDLETFRGRQCTMISFLTEGVQNCALSFTLFWTLFYGLVYLF